MAFWIQFELSLKLVIGTLYNVDWENIQQNHILWSETDLHCLMLYLYVMPLSVSYPPNDVGNQLNLNVSTINQHLSTKKNFWMVFVAELMLFGCLLSQNWGYNIFSLHLRGFPHYLIDQIYAGKECKSRMENPSLFDDEIKLYSEQFLTVVIIFQEANRSKLLSSYKDMVCTLYICAFTS